MLREIFKRDFQDQLFTFRFLFGFAFCLVVFPVFAAILADNYRSRQERYLARVQESEEKLCLAMEEVKKADLGISVTAQGLFQGVERCCRKTGLSFHTVALSLGVLGPMELIPDPDILAISTMCGHGYVTFNLARKALDDVAAGHRDVDDVCKELARPCLCGIFSPVRAREILLSKKKG